MAHADVVTELIHIFVEISRHEQKKVEFATDRVTGQQIKTEAGIPSENDLARRQGQKLELVTNDQTITIKNGEHFISLPPGTIS
jgi:hypothetical protein